MILFSYYLRGGEFSVFISADFDALVYFRGGLSSRFLSVSVGFESPYYDDGGLLGKVRNIPFKMKTMVKSREHPYVSKTNLITFRALIFTISLRWVRQMMQNLRSCGRILNIAEKASSATRIWGENLISGGNSPCENCTILIRDWIFSLSYVSKENASAINSSNRAHFMKSYCVSVLSSFSMILPRLLLL